MDYEKYKRPLKKFRDKKNFDHGPITGLYAYEIKKLNKNYRFFNYHRDYRTLFTLK